MDIRERLQSSLEGTYTIERELGGGGMSRVFLATETALGRNVVVKVLSSEMIADISAERFAREVRLAASLQHPNIVPVLTTGVADGVPYYTMPFVKGESLRARMHEMGTIPRRQAVSILRDLARALQYAHSEGVVHRDIKPENILLSGDAAVVTDFGIAKAISVARLSGNDESNQPQTLTRAGSSIGTPSYMAPEQVAGDPVDQRTDLYAWGLIAYELLASTHPFAGKANIQQVLSAQLAELPAPLGTAASNISPSLADLVMKCLEKDSSKRPESAAEILDALEPNIVTREQPTFPPARRRFKAALPLVVVIIPVIAFGVLQFSRRTSGSSGSDSHSSVAVLPFADDGADSANAYFGEGIADELMTELGKVPGLRVASRTSSIAVGKRKDLDVREIGRQLGVSTVVEGTVRRSGGRLRVTAQLTNASDGLTIWSDVFERENQDVFAVQDDITRAIVAALRPELSGSTQVAARKGPGTSNAEAYDLYLRGQYLVERRGPGVAKAADYFSQAIEKDPNFARAYAALSAALELLPYFGSVPAYRVEDRARAMANRALQLDPALAEPRVALAMADWHALKWDETDREFRRAIAADSTSAVARTQYGRYLITSGRVAEAIPQLRIARRLDPLAATSSVWLSYGLAKAGFDTAAAEESMRSRELDPNLLNNRTILVLDLVHAGKFKEALTTMGNITAPTAFTGIIAYNLEMAGDKVRAARLRSSLDALPDTIWGVHAARAYSYMATSDTGKALTEMEAALARRELLAYGVPFVDPLYDPVRQSPRFAEIVKKLGLDGRGLTGPPPPP